MSNATNAPHSRACTSCDGTGTIDMSDCPCVSDCDACGGTGLVGDLDELLEPTPPDMKTAVAEFHAMVERVAFGKAVR